MNQQNKYNKLTRAIGQLLSLAKLYDINHPTYKENSQQMFRDVSEFMSREKASLVFSEPAEGIFMINGEKLDFKENLSKRFAENFHELELGSLEIDPGLTYEEFNVFIHLISRVEKIQGEESIKQYLKEKQIKHIIPRFVTYKLVQDDEKVVKQASVVEIEELNEQTKRRLSEDLSRGEVESKLKSEDKSYQILAHDPEFLHHKIINYIKDLSSPEQISKILWLIGDYLIGEIGTARQEEINRKVLEELKNRLIKQFNEKQDSNRWKDEAEKTFTSVTAALQLKGFILLYKKHKKEVENVVEKIKKILETLPPESQLYLKSKEELNQIGTPTINF